MVHAIKYPEEARKKGVQGTVYITFVIEEDGSITDAKVLRGIGSGCDEEALRGDPRNA
jgi:protein TonB